MFQCSLYGVTDKKFEWNCEKFTRTEKVFRNKQKVAIVTDCSNLNAIFYDIPDKNKQRSSIVMKIVRTEDCEKALDLLGYQLQRINTLTGFKYQRNGYIIEISKFMKRDLVDSSEEETAMDDNIPSHLFEKYLVKVYIETEDIAFGEMILQKASLDLMDVIKLTKPNLSIF